MGHECLCGNWTNNDMWLECTSCRHSSKKYYNQRSKEAQMRL